MTRPTPVTPVVTGDDQVAHDRLPGPHVKVDDALLERLRGACAEVSINDADRTEAGRDWWPIAIGWANRGAVASRPAAIAKPGSVAEVAAVLACCNEARVPVTAAAGRSGVCGSSIPVFGGVSLDMTGIEGVTDIDTTSLVCDVNAGTFGPDLERTLGGSQVTLGHWPQSMDLSTVGGWIACRGAGQYSTRYGKIEDMVVGLEVVLADGSRLRTGGMAPRAAVGPDLNELFVGSEGTLGVVVSSRLRLHPTAPAQDRRAWGFASKGRNEADNERAFTAGLEVCRRILRRGATPAVLRLYDPTESQRNFADGDHAVLIVLDEADPLLLRATMEIVDDECRTAGADVLDAELVERWLGHRNDVSALAPLYKAGIVVDTVEIAGKWATLPGLYTACIEALTNVEGTLAASAHQSHSYTDGACIYLTFAGRMPEDPQKDPTSDEHNAWAERYYNAAWESVMDAVITSGAAISHHHGIGLNRSRFMEASLGSGSHLIEKLKSALDPRGILNPGKLGIPSQFGQVGWP
ncbi:MAG: FAD-binding oxidoreductase [Acidimicrobiales bacterium]